MTHPTDAELEAVKQNLGDLRMFLDAGAVKLDGDVFHFKTDDILRAIDQIDKAAAMLRACKGRVKVKALEWDFDGRKLRMDDTMLFSKGYDWDAYECLRQEGYGTGSSYIIWPDKIGSTTWNLYGTRDGLFITDLEGEEAAKAAAQADYAALEPVADRAEWQPIETAPRDGSRFLAYEPTEPYQIYECWYQHDFTQFCGWQDDWDSEPRPTHWMPRPASPALKKGQTND